MFTYCGQECCPRRVFYVSAKDNTDLSVTRARFMTNLHDLYWVTIKRSCVFVCSTNAQKKSRRHHRSVVYKRAGMHLVELHNLWKHKAMDEKSFYINDDEFLTTASQPPESFIKVRIEVSLSYLRHYSYPWGQDPPFLCHMRSNISWCG